MLKRIVLVMAMLISCVGCDQTSKSVAKTYLSETQAVSYVGGSVRLQIAKNYGAFLGLGTSLPRAQRNALFSAGVGVLLAGLLAYCLTLSPNNRFTVPSLGLIIGGGTSNLIDRLLYDGYVVDFLNVGIGSVRTGIFNLADVFIMVGVLLLLSGDWLCRQFLDSRLTKST